MLLLLISGCTNTLQSQYKRNGSDVFLQFTIDVTEITSTSFFKVELNNITNILSINYVGSSTSVDDSAPGITFTGHVPTGNISFIISNIGSDRGGTYRLHKAGADPLQCITVYVLGECGLKYLESQLMHVRSYGV